MNLFKHTSIAAFLREYIENLPKKGRGEARKIADHLNVSTTLVSQILAGEKLFTIEQAQSISVYLGLKGLEADYLVFLAQFERSGTSNLRTFWKIKLEKVKSEHKRLSQRIEKSKEFSENEKAIFYSNPIYSAVRLFASTGAEGRTLEEICHRFRISRGRALEVLQFLESADLVKKDSDFYKMGAQKTHLESHSPHLFNHRRNWRFAALQRSNELSESELIYSAPVSLSKEDFDHLREEMVAFIKTFLDRVHASPAEDVACLNLDFFWIE